MMNGTRPPKPPPWWQTETDPVLYSFLSSVSILESMLHLVGAFSVLAGGIGLLVCMAQREEFPAAAAAVSLAIAIGGAIIFLGARPLLRGAVVLVRLVRAIEKKEET